MALADHSIQTEAVDRRSFRTAMSKFATGVAVLTGRHAGESFGMTINSLTSVSLDPLQILVCVNHGSATGEAIKASGRFAVSLLEREQKHVAQSFVGRDAARFEAVQCFSSGCGMPLVPGALASLVCQISDVVTSGDHDIVIGNVLEIAQGEGEPLVFFGGSYGALATTLREQAA